MQLRLFIWINKGYVKVTLPKTNCRFYFLTDVITSLYTPDVVTPDVNQYKPSKMFDFCLISPKNMEKSLQNIFIINFDLRWDKRGLHFFVGLWEWLSLLFAGVPKPYGFVTLSRLICVNDFFFLSVLKFLHIVVWRVAVCQTGSI